MKVCSKHDVVKTYYKSRSKWVCPKCETAAVTKRRQVVKRELVKAAGGKCIRCEYDRCIDALVFHHRNPAEKDGGLSNWKKSLRQGLEEIKKCDLLCANCHAEIHAEWRENSSI